MEDLLDAIAWGFKSEEKAFLSLSLCQAVRGRRGSRQTYILESGCSSSRGSGAPALGVGRARGTGSVGVGRLQETFGRSAHPSLLKDFQSHGSSPWLCLPFLGTCAHPSLTSLSQGQFQWALLTKSQDFLSLVSKLLNGNSPHCAPSQSF